MLYYFIFGILFASIIMPILNSISDCACSRMEQYKAKCALTISKINKKIEEYSEVPINEHPIGFQIPSESEYTEEFDE